INLPILDSLIIGLLIAFSSTSIMMNVINQQGFRGREINGFLTAEQIVEDAASILVLTAIAGFKNSEITSGSSGVLSLFVPVAFSFAIIGVVYVVLERVVKWFLGCLECYDNNDAMILASLSVAAVFIFLSDMLGLPLSTGAFLAGSLVSSVDGFRKVEQSIIQFNAVFAAFFFFSIGMAFKFQPTLTFVLILAAVCAMNILAKFGAGSLSTYLFGFDSKNSIYAGLALIPIGEFSLLMAGQLAPYASLDIVSITACAVIISAIVSSRMVYREEMVEGTIVRFVPAGVLASMKSISSYADTVIAYFEPGGQGFGDFISHGKRMLNNIVIAMLVAGCAVVLAIVIDVRNITSQDVLLSHIVFLGGLLVSLVPLFFALREAKNMLAVLARGFVIDKGEGARLDVRIERDFGAFLALFAVSALIPMFFTAISLPKQFNYVSLAPFAISLIFLYDASMSASKVLRMRARKHSEARGLASMHKRLKEKMGARLEGNGEKSQGKKASGKA
ncbi:MAG TPA: cation:proton antiporter, partial [Candidatus Micrarchaeota archaeon]|nr:cation:proton antiporter [Candidatus Micrarchaeota archaeon]